MSAQNHKPKQPWLLTTYISKLKAIQHAARAVADEFKLTPGGDNHFYEGSTNEVDTLEEALVDLESYLWETGKEDMY